MRRKAFASRNLKEILRDPLTLIFGMGLPVVLLALLSLIQRNIPVPLFEVHSITPGMAVFSFSFISLFSGLLIAKDRTGSFLLRLFASPLTAGDYIVGYTLPLLPMALLQALVCILAALIFGLKIGIGTVFLLLSLIPTAILYIGVGMIFGVSFTDKQVGGFFSIFVNLTAWMSGIWFDVELVGGVYKSICACLPFYHAVELARAALAGDAAGIFPHLWWVLAYAVCVLILAVLLFKRRMRAGK